MKTLRGWGGLARTSLDTPQEPLGKGIVREVRNRGRVLVEICGRATEVLGSQITPLVQ